MAQFRELLSTGLFTVIVLFSVVACSSNDDVDEFTDTSYTFDGIEWAIDEGNVQENKIVIPEEVYKNGTDIEQSVTLCAVENYTQTSQFFSDDPKLFQIMAQTPINVPIPSSEVVVDGFFHVSGGPEVPLSLEEYHYRPQPYSTHSTKIPPHTMLIYNATLLEQTVTATYRAYLTGNDTGKQIEIMGQWKGTYYKKSHDVLRVEDIK